MMRWVVVTIFLIYAIILGWIFSPLVVRAQHSGEFGGANADKALEGERDKDGDRIQLNLKGVSATPTPAATNRCAVQCDAVTDKLMASVNGGAYQVLAAGTGNGCECAGSGSNSTAAGVGATASGSAAVCFGDDSECTATNTTGVGRSVSVTGASSTVVGYGASSTASSGTCVGAICTITGINSTCVGKDCTLTGTETVQLGDAGGLPTTGTYGVCLGSSNVACSGAGPICIGQGSNCTNGGHCIGRGCSESSNNKLGIGSTTYPIQNLCVGHGCGTTTESVAGQVQASDLTGGTDKSAGPLQLRGGAGTGTGAGGNIQFRFCAPGSTGSSVNSCTTAWHIDGSTGELISDGHELHFSDTYGIYFDDGNTMSLKYDSGVGGVVLNPGAGFLEVTGNIRANQVTADTGGIINQGQNTTVPENADITGTSYQFTVSNVPEFYITADGSYTLASAPTLTAGQDGQTVWIWNADGADTITFHDDGDGGVASNLQLGAATRALAQNDGLCLHYIGVLGDWVECGFVNN